MFIGILAFFALLSAYCYHVGRRHGGDASAFARSRGRGGFFLSLDFMGVLVSFLWVRTGARDRLAAAGITPHPALVAPSGLSAGQAGDTRT